VHPYSSGSILHLIHMEHSTTTTGFVEWTHNGGQHGRHASMLSTPLRPING
jgi:hypothetical protein